MLFELWELLEAAAILNEGLTAQQKGLSMQVQALLLTVESHSEELAIIVIHTMNIKCPPHICLLLFLLSVQDLS